MARLGLSLLVATIMVLALHAPATATLITNDPANNPEAEWVWYFPPYYAVNGRSSYDAVADIFTLTDYVLGAILPDGSSPGYNFFEASSFFLIAGVDGTGQLLGGTVIWLGGIPSLGVPTGTTLLAGDVIAVYYGFSDGGGPPGAPGVQFVIQVEESLPALGLGPTVGYFDRIIPWSLPGDPPPLRPEPWSTSFDCSCGWSWDDLANVRPIPQAPTLVLFLATIGLGRGLVSLARRTRWSTGHR